MPEVSHLLLLTDYRWLVIGTFVGVAKTYISGLRWRYLASCCNRLSIKNSFYFYSLGVMTNMLLPFRLGDLLRTRLIAESLKIPNTQALGTIVSEHLLDFIMLSCLLLTCFTFYTYTWPTHVFPTVVTFLFITFTLFGIIFFLKKYGNSFLIQKVKKNYYSFLPNQFAFLPNMLHSFYSGLFQFNGFLNLIKILVSTTCIWFAQGLWIYTLLCALGIPGNAQLLFETSLVLMVTIGIAVMIPSSPGYIGTFHLIIMLGLTQMGVSQPLALSYAILAHAHAVLVALLLGIYSAWKGNIKTSLHLSIFNRSTTTLESP